jgi:4-hydroxyphenylpyruvate dioxygenase
MSGTLREKFEAISSAGFDGVEIFEPDFLASGQSPREVGTMARDHGLSITLYQPFRDYEGNPVKSRHERDASLR